MTVPADLSDPVARIRLALAIFGAAGPLLGGLWLRARPSPARDAVLQALDTALPEAARIGPETEDLALSGGVDVGASLATGRRVVTAGLLAGRGRMTLVGAERARPALAARLAQALDTGRWALVAVDESADADEALGPALAARCGVFLEFEGLSARDAAAIARPMASPIGPWRDLPVSAELETVLAEYAAFLGLSDARLALASRLAARVAAALRGSPVVTREDVDVSAALVMFPRGEAPQIPPEVESEPQEAPPSELRDDGSDHALDDAAGEPPERVVASQAAAIPPALLELSGSAPAAGSRGAGAGATHRGTTRGRPLPSRPGRSSARARIDPVATLRAAIPWQRLRTASPRGQRIALRPSDIRIRRFEERSDRVVIFAVDASGSQAMARMAEAKGAVECLLGEAYRRRDQVAMVAFRGQAADILLPPTRALVRARNALQALPAGGATPLAAGLGAAAALASQARSAGATPIVVLLSDGRANIALDGEANRARAGEDATAAAHRLAASGIECLVLDTGRRPEAALETLAREMRGRYLAMPFAQARDMSAAVAAALDR